MSIDRRRFLDLAAAVTVASVLPRPLRAAEARPLRFKAVAFDAFPVFDPRPIGSLAETLFPGKGAELGGAWRTRQFEYQWLRVLGGRYEDFWRTTEEALIFAAAQLGLDLTPERRDRLMQAYLQLTAWPDAPAALAALRVAGVRLAFLSNMTAKMLEAGIRSAKLDGLFEHVLSTDSIRTYKPDPRAYRLAIDALHLEREEILFVSFAGWDAAGARWFGYPTYWNNRLGLPPEELGAHPDATGRDLSELPRFVASPARDAEQGGTR
jgi:2-haloacid dehalogenase